MGLKKADRDARKETHANAYHRILPWRIPKAPYQAVTIICTVFTFRSKADAEALDAAIADPEYEGKPTEFGPISEREYRFTLEDFGGKDKLTMAETYKLLKSSDQHDSFLTDATDA